MVSAIDSNDYNDYEELEIALDEQNADESKNTISLSEELPSILKTKTFRSKIESSKSNKSAVSQFLAAVNVDLKRREPIGLFSLFTVWLELGNKYWLNPVDKEKGLGVLEEILFKFQGDEKVLSPFIELLVKVAKNKISPRSFIEYVILPRMHQDFNWRKWRENHLEALQIIADLINSIKDRPPFNQEHLGSGKTRLARDVVLVRYIGRPLAQFQLPQLHDSAMLDNYISAWQKISLQTPLTLYFMRNNALHFLYLMSGKIDLIQLIAIIQQLPAIEQSFIAAFPDGIVKLKNIQSMNLYDYDIENALLIRRQRGFHNLDFTVEIKAYFNIVNALLQKPTGVYLCAYYAGLLNRYKDPDIAEIILKLINIVYDQGGMHIYKWHTEMLLGKHKNDRQTYVDYVEENHGCDPEYPQLIIIFRNEEQTRENTELANLITNLRLERYFTVMDQISFKQLLNAYVEEHPDSTELITDYQQQLLFGLDRKWSDEYIQQLDQLNIHSVLLRSVIRGIGSRYSVPGKSSSFSELLEKYGEVKSQIKIYVNTEFIMPVKQFISSSADQDAVARKQINLIPVEKVWNSMCNTEPLSIGNVLTFINKWAIKLDEPLEIAFNEKVSLENLLNETNDEDAKKKTQDKIEKQDKTIKALQNKKQNYTIIMDEFNMLDNGQIFILAVILAGTEGRSDDEFTSFVTGLFLQRYKELDGITSRISFLKEDISVDVLSYQQFLYFLNLLDTLFYVLNEDINIINLLNNDTILLEILAPYLITKKKIVSLDALDAAAKKMTGYASMQAERAKWQGILDKLNQKNEKYFHDMEIYTSKTFIDSYYGDMGGICLSSLPEQVLRPGFYVQRLIDKTDSQIVGMSILYLSNGGFGSPQVQAKNFWQAFAFNPLSSILSHYSKEQQLYLYLQFRINMEKTAWMTKMPIVLSGIDTSYGLISNNGHFGDLIRRYEYSKPTAKKVSNAKGLSFYYSQAAYAIALVIIDPRGYEQATDLSQIPSFYAHRELKDADSFFE
jgi:hypothetical protein